MNVILILTISLLVSTGVYLTLSRDLLRVILGLSVLGVAANLVVFYAGSPGATLSAIMTSGMAVLPAGAANPLPQALVLTAIVIGFALLCFALVLMVVISKLNQTRDVNNMHHSEPKGTENKDSKKPTILEAE